MSSDLRRLRTLILTRIRLLVAQHRRMSPRDLNRRHLRAEIDGHVLVLNLIEQVAGQPAAWTLQRALVHDSDSDVQPAA